MKTNDTRPRGRRPHGGGRRRQNHRDHSSSREPRAAAPRKLSLWQKFLSLFTRGQAKTAPAPERTRSDRSGAERRRPAPPAPVAVTTPKLYIGNLSYEATESDLFELFKGVGQVQNAEIVTHRDTYQSKGFGFVTMLTVEEALRAVETLHDKDFMGRRLVVTGSRTSGPQA